MCQWNYKNNYCSFYEYSPQTNWIKPWQTKYYYIATYLVTYKLHNISGIKYIVRIIWKGESGEISTYLLCTLI